jgi:hypothetical protein
VESVESQEQASHPSHEPLGNLAKSLRDSHIPTTPATKADGKVENQTQVFHFPTASVSLSQEQKNTRAGFALARATTQHQVVPFSAAPVVNFYSALDNCISHRFFSAETTLIPMAILGDDVT